MLTLFLEVEETRTDTDDDGGIGCREERFDRGRSRRPQSRGRGEVYFAVARGAWTVGRWTCLNLDGRKIRNRRREGREEGTLCRRIPRRTGDRRSDIGSEWTRSESRPRVPGQGPGPRGQGPREGTQRDCTIQQSTCDNNNNSNHHKNIVIQG